MNAPSPLRATSVALLAGLSLLLSGCLLSPGKFTSELILLEDDKFTFTYEGEIFFMGLSALAQMSAEADAAAELDVTCYDDETFEERECTEAEIAEQRASASAGVLDTTCFDEETFEERECTEAELADQRASAEAERERNRQQAEQMAAIMGGIDPSDPAAAEELTALLLRQKGWERVEDKGNGVFDVTYSVTGTLSHDFMFPLIEGFPTLNPFVQIFIRDDSVLRINAPGFAAENDDNPMMGSMGGMAGLAAMGAQSGSDDPTAAALGDVPVLDGTFTIVTSGRILANNTDEGPNPTPNGEMLEWDVSPRTKSAPTALIDLSR